MMPNGQWFHEACGCVNGFQQHVPKASITFYHQHFPYYYSLFLLTTWPFPSKSKSQSFGLLHHMDINKITQANNSTSSNRYFDSKSSAMRTWLIAYSYLGLVNLGLVSITLWAFFSTAVEPIFIPILLIEASLALHLCLKTLTSIHNERPHLYASAAAVDRFLMSTRRGGAYMAVAASLWAILLAFGGIGLFMGGIMRLADPPDVSLWDWMVVLFMWISYLSLFVYVLFVWVVSVRMALFGPQEAIMLL